MTEVKSLYDIGYEHGVRDTLDKYDEICRMASEIRIAVGCKTAKECWELARNGDIQVVKHGRWIDNRVAFHRVCSECGAVIRQDITLVYLLECMDKVGHLNYCPNCGADMRPQEEVHYIPTPEWLKGGETR